LSRETRHRTSDQVAALFDMDLRARRRDRAARKGAELFLFERVFADCLDRITLVQRSFEHALLIGCPDAEWPKRLRDLADVVEVRDPGRLFAEAAGGEQLIEDDWRPQPLLYDLVVTIGTLDTVNDLPLALRILFEAMTEGALLIGAMSGGDSLPQLRNAARAADAVTGAASPHVHPRVEASAVAPLMTGTGFAMPVVDVDRIEVRYRTLATLVSDLRAMGATNVLERRSRTPLLRGAYCAAHRAFETAGTDGRTAEIFEILHFAAWKGQAGNR